MVSIGGFLVLVAIIIVSFLVAGAQISAFVNDTLGAFGSQVRDDEIKIDAPQQGQVVCDIFVTANWREKGTLAFALDPIPILFFDPRDEAGVGINIDYQNCKIASGGFQFASLLDFLGTTDEVVPLEFIIPDIPIFDQPYELSWVLVDPNTGKERKVLHYQNIEYIVPAGVFDFRYEQKLVFREVVPDDYVLKIIPKIARFFDQTEGDPFLFVIQDPTLSI